MIRHVPTLALLLLLCAGVTVAACRHDGQVQPAPPAAAQPDATPVADEGARGATEVARAPLLKGLGEHSHPITTDNALSQRYFDQGLTLAFGFNHAEAGRSFAEAARLDPSCAMCYWGQAFVLGPNINAAMDPANAPKAYDLVQQAIDALDDETPRERAYVYALAKRYAAKAHEDRSGLDQAFAEAMGEVARQYPDDLDAQVLYAESLMDLHPWDYWKDSGEAQPWTEEILAVLENVLDRAPEHPMANHLYIHAVEASPTPDKGLQAARRLERMIPGAGHLVHMPAHIYIRVGDYHAASLANERAIEADESYLAQVDAQGAYPLAYYPHNYHFLWATTTQEGRSERAIEAAWGTRERVDTERMREPAWGTLQHYYAIPYYALTTFGRWDELLALQAPPGDLHYTRGVYRWARGMALTHEGRLEDARQELAALRNLADSDEVAQITIWDINPTSSLLHIGAEVLAGSIALAEGDREGAVDHMKKAVALEDTLNYDEPPPWGHPTRRYLGAVYLAADMPAQAESVFRQDLEEFPRNGWSLFGLSQALERQGEEAAAREAAEAFADAWAHADFELTTPAVLPSSP